MSSCSMNSFVRSTLFSPWVVLAALLAAGLAGCSSLPPLPERTASAAMTDTVGTTLGQLAAASLKPAVPGESGFRLLPTGDFAFDARLALAQRAERAFDVQYYRRTLTLPSAQGA
jgi:cardiolipin synthase C